MMRPRQYRVFLSWVLGVFLSATLAAQNSEPSKANYSTTSVSHAKSSAPRLLTADEGLAVIGAALESRVHTGSKSDCSHLVHAIYERAGFPYVYASSSSLYAGIEEFRRVGRPQPGDLVVWPGHVGIAVNPAQHTFFSALRSGHGVEPYDSAYWRERGRPRFLRYVSVAPTSPASPSSREVSLKTASSSDPHPDPASSDNISFETTEQQQTLADPLPSVISFATVHSERPTPGELTAALANTLTDSGGGLAGLDMLNPSRPLIVFDQLAVERVRIRHDRGWAEVRLTGALKFSKQKTSSTKHNESQRWVLIQRDREHWEITLPPDAIYIPSDVAVRTLAHELAALTDDTMGSTSAQQKMQLTRLLNLSLSPQKSLTRP